MPAYEIKVVKDGESCPPSFTIRREIRATRRHPAYTVCMKKRDLKAEKAAKTRNMNNLANLFGKVSFGRERSRSRSRSRSPRGSPKRNNTRRSAPSYYVPPRVNYRNTRRNRNNNANMRNNMVVQANNVEMALNEIVRKMKL